MSSPEAPAAAPVAKATDAAAPRSRSSRRMLLMGGVLSVVVLLAGGIFWMLSGPPKATPEEQFTEAVQKIDAKDIEAARDIAKPLQDAQFHPEAFPNGVAYILGMAAFHEAEAETDPASETRTTQYAVAASFLREAGQADIPEERHPEWSFALGKSLLAGGELSAARPLLEDAYEHHPTQKAAVAKLVADLYLNPSWRSPELLEKALVLNTVALEGTTEPAERDFILLQRADIHLALGKASDAETALSEVKATDASRFGSIVLKGRMMIRDGRHAEAIDALKPVGESSETESVYPRQAMFLMGYAADMLIHQEVSADQASDPKRLEFRQAANEYFQKSIDRYPQTDEGFAAQVMLAQLQQEDGAHEKSLRTFGTVLRAVKRAEDFQNRWMSVDQFRQRTLSAWNQWTRQGRYPEAIALAEMMIPLFSRDQANELTARVRQRAAEALSDELLQEPYGERKRRRAEELKRWSDSGKAHADLAESRRNSVNFASALWTSAEHYARGQDFTKALAKYDEFLAQGITVDSERPVATVRRCQMLLDLDRPQEALEQFDDLLRTTPTSPYIFAAQWLRGQCLLELDRPEEAEAAWRTMLASNGLTPAATEWRDALHALAKLLTDTAALDKRRASSRNETEPVDQNALWNAVALRSQEAIRRWEEFLNRYPASPQVAEARYYFGKALHLQAEWIDRQSQAAETDNARQQTRKQYERTLERAMNAFLDVRDTLTPLAQKDLLNDLDAQILQSAWFELPHAQHQLGRYEEAIASYTAAANRYPQDVRVLTAYVQMAQAYAQIGKHIESRSVLEQAKVIMDQQQIPLASFKAPTTNLTREEWEMWLARVRQVQH